MHLLLVVALGYFAVNFVCALVLHVHNLHQAHRQPRFLDVLMHFVLMGALGVPVLLITTGEALFGGERGLPASYEPVAQHR